MTGRNNFIEGASEDDTINVQRTSFTIVTGGGGNDTITGNAGGDTLRGGSGDDTIYGRAGSDLIIGDGGDDMIYGGTGNDVLMGYEGDDTIYGGAGDDDIDSGTGSDTLTGGAGADTFIFRGGTAGETDTIKDFNVSHDKINLKLLPNEISAHTDLTFGTDVNGNVTITHADLGSTIVLEGVTDKNSLKASNFELPDPQDSISVNGGRLHNFENPWEGSESGDFFMFNNQSATHNGNGGSDWLFGGEGDDTMNGGTGCDWLVGEEGADTITGGAHNDELYGGEGNDTIYGGAHDDEIYGGEGNDTIYGGAGADTIDGGADDDEIYGGAGADAITGGTGDDTMTGGAGADTFVFAAGHGNDAITDFDNGTDKIDLSAFSSITGFSNLTITQEGTDVKIDLSAHGGGEITLEDFTSTDLDATDFDFSM